MTIQLAISVFGISALLVFRYINFYKSEHTRRNYLGVYPIKIVRYKSLYLVTGIVILFFGIGGGWYIDDYNEPKPIKDYLAYRVFSIEETILPETFLQIRDPASPYSGGNVLAALSVLASLFISNRDIHLPKFIWSLSKPYTKIQLKDISSSYLPSEEVSINTKKDVSKRKSEVFVVKEKNTVIGLLSHKAVEKFELGKNPKLKQIFDDNIESNENKIEKNNFIVVKNSLTLDKLKEMMESEGKIYAVIFDDEEKMYGVVEYSDLFGKPKIFA